jgi:Hydrolase of X-linked nucleoside diphosphate N terminal
MEKTLLDFSREIQAISSSGLYFSKDPYDLQRFKQLNEIAAELIAKHSLHSKQFVSKVFGGVRVCNTEDRRTRGNLCKQQNSYG